VLALTLIRPWPRAIFAESPRPKRVENRTWAPPAGTVVGQHIAIHAGKKWDEQAAVFIRDQGVELGPEAAVEGAIVGVVRVAKVVALPDTAEGKHAASIGRATITFDPKLRADPWFFGPVGWLLDDVVAIAQPVRAMGQQGLWRLTDDEERAVLRQLPPRFDVDGLLEDERGAA
jgi:hypothetical protein